MTHSLHIDSIKISICLEHTRLNTFNISHAMYAPYTPTVIPVVINLINCIDILPTKQTSFGRTQAHVSYKHMYMNITPVPVSHWYIQQD